MPVFPDASERLGSVASALNRLGALLKIVGVKQMPCLVFDDDDDWFAVMTILPLTEEDPMLAGFHFDYRRKPADHAKQFVDQEIGA